MEVCLDPTPGKVDQQRPINICPTATVYLVVVSPGRTTARIMGRELIAPPRNTAG